MTDSLHRLNTAVPNDGAPVAAIDLDALDANARFLTAAAGGYPIRVASKSIRCTSIIRHVLDHHPGFRGVMAFTPDEAVHLARAGFDDLLVAYPSVDVAGIRNVAEAMATTGATIRLVVDDPAHVALISASAGALAGTGRSIPLCMEIDLGWRPLGGLLKVGPKRSPIRTPEQAAALAAQICATEHVELNSLLAYEGHIAGVGDIIPGRPLRQLVIRQMQAASLKEIAARLPAVIDAVEQTLARRGAPPLELVNGGGSGSLQRTAEVGAVTELAAGSGLFNPVLFDSYRSLALQPAVAYAMPVVRKPMANMATLLGGGYPASGVPGPDRAPTPALPTGLTFDRDEGAGEVQSPLHGAAGLHIGDRVWLRHAKSGELFERFNEVHLVRAGNLEATVPTYRGEGRCFV
ncbi:alanine racemase [Tomitella biformata]|uniref:alanine racemase n=1 Tax=Tomitella biformata TaxID=630403 RepID=UPI0004B3FD8A|nr:alanine racemase [Tomitella biformata]